MGTTLERLLHHKRCEKQAWPVGCVFCNQTRQDVIGAADWLGIDEPVCCGTGDDRIESAAKAQERARLARAWNQAVNQPGKDTKRNDSSRMDR